MKTALIAAAAMFTLHVPAFAQDAAATPAAPSEAEAAAVAEPAQPAGDNAGFSDSDLSKFAVAAQKVNEINAAGAPDAQTKMVEAVQASGISPNVFNDIATKMQQHEGLRIRIAQLAGAAAGAASSPDASAGS